MRLVVAFLFMTHGAQKLFGYPSGDPIAVANIATLYGFAGILEFFGGVMILIGFLTRPIAFLLLIEMVVAYFKVHAPQGPWPLLNGGELAVLYGVMFLFLTAAGAGKFSVDGMRGNE
jgi:putative oxidoreductase